MTDSQAVTPTMAVYYPYIHFRDERWLKIAALYWPGMIRIVDPNYPTRDSELVKILKSELGFITEDSPTSAAQAVASSFAGLVMSLGERTRMAWQIPPEAANRKLSELNLPRPPWRLEDVSESCAPRWEHYGPREWWRHDGLAGVHSSEMDQSLARSLIDAELAAPARGEWLAMRPELAWIYKCSLTEEYARRNHLLPTTDQLSAHAVIDDSIIIGRQDGHGGVGVGSSTRAELSNVFGLLAIKAVIPDDVDHIPADKIVEVRRRFGDQFDRWRQHIDSVGMELAEELQDVESPEVLHKYLTHAVNRYAAAPVKDLRGGLADLGIEAASIAINSKFELPTALAATGLLTQTPLAVGAGVALAAINLRRSTKAKAKAIRSAPSAYLLSLQETLTPRGWLSRIMATMRRATGMAS